MIVAFRTHWRLSKISKTCNKSVWSSAFWHIKIYMFWKLHWVTLHTLYIELKHKCEKTLQKMHSFFFPEPQLIRVLLLIHNSYTGWSTRFISLKVREGFFIFDSVLFLLKFIFLFNKKHGLFDFKALSFLSKWE